MALAPISKHLLTDHFADKKEKKSDLQCYFRLNFDTSKTGSYVIFVIVELCRRFVLFIAISHDVNHGDNPDKTDAS